VVWIWSPIETRDIASEAGISKATLTGVLNTLEGRGWLERQRSSEDGRLMVVTLTPAGSKLMKKLFPKFNDQEIATVSQVPRAELEKFTANLRSLTRSVEGS
jgi:DNA-binding MarR family transcriptional regulator